MSNCIYAPKERRIFFTDGACGSGKSTAISKLIAKRSRQRIQLCVGITERYLNQWADVLEQHTVRSRITVISTNNKKSDESVTNRILQWIDEHRDYPGILLITQKAFGLISDNGAAIGNRAKVFKYDIDLYFDEMPPGFVVKKIKIHKVPELLTSRLELGARVSKCTDGDFVSKVEASDCNALRSELKNESHLFPSDDKHLSQIAQLMHSVLDPREHVLILESQWQAIGEFVARGDASGGGTEFLILKNPNQYRRYHSVSLISADFSTSAFTKVVNISGGFRWQKVRLDLRNNGRYSVEMQRRVNIYHVMDDERKVNSKQFLKANGEYVDSQFTSALDSLDCQKFLFCTNGDRLTNRDIANRVGCTPISAKSHGMNCYSDVDVIVYDIAMNLSPIAKKMTDSFGINTFEELNVNSLHQVAMRSSLRNPMATGDVNIFVVDKPIADGLARKLGGGRVRPIGALIGTNEKYQHQKGSVAIGASREVARPREAREKGSRVIVGDAFGGDGFAATSADERLKMRIIPVAPNQPPLKGIKASPNMCIANGSQLECDLKPVFFTTEPLSRKLKGHYFDDVFELKNRFIQQSIDGVSRHFIPCDFELIHYESRSKRDRVELTQSHMAVYELSKTEFSKAQLLGMLNPKRGKKAFLVAEDESYIQVVFLLNKPACSESELIERTKPVRALLRGVKCATVQKVRFFDDYEAFNCRNRRELDHRAL